MADWDYEEGGMIGTDEQRTEEVNRKVTPVFFLIDVSGSMAGKKIDIVNNVMEAIIHDLGNMNSSDNEIRYAVLSFSDDCIWETSGLQPCNSNYREIIAGNCSCFNSACRELNSRLSHEKQGLLNYATNAIHTPPIIILFSSRSATDGDPDGKDGIADLKQNKYFEFSYKLAFAIGNDSNQNLCINFTGDKNLVFTAYNDKIFRALVDAAFNESSFIYPETFSDMDDDLESGTYSVWGDNLETNAEDWD